MWHKGQGFAKGVVDDFPVQLFFRIATVADVRQKGQEAYLKQQVSLICLLNKQTRLFVCDTLCTD